MPTAFFRKVETLFFLLNKIIKTCFFLLQVFLLEHVFVAIVCIRDHKLQLRFRILDRSEKFNKIRTKLER